MNQYVNGTPIANSSEYQEALMSIGEREEITQWLQWNDPNGVYTDENCDLECLPRMDLDDAVKMMGDALSSENETSFIEFLDGRFILAKDCPAYVELDDLYVIDHGEGTKGGRYECPIGNQSWQDDCFPRVAWPLYKFAVSEGAIS